MLRLAEPRSEIFAADEDLDGVQCSFLQCDSTEALDGDDSGVTEERSSSNQ
jgi:hypothetical protein